MTVCSPIKAGLVAITVTPGRTAPELSETVPLILPPACPWASAADENTTRAVRTTVGDRIPRRPTSRARYGTTHPIWQSHIPPLPLNVTPGVLNTPFTPT